MNGEDKKFMVIFGILMLGFGFFIGLFVAGALEMGWISV